MNTSVANLNFSRLDNVTSSRQARFFGPLLGFLLASVFPNLSIAKLGHIKIEYDPVPQINASPIVVYPAPWVPETAPTEDFHLEPTVQPPLHFANHVHPQVVNTVIESPHDFIVPSQSKISKVSVKRAISSRYLAPFRRNRLGTRRRYPDYLEYDNYDYLTTLKLRNRKRNQGRRPIGFDDDYDYDYDYGKPQRRKNQRRKIKNKNRRDPDYYGDEDFNDDVEPVTVVIRPRQQQTTTPTTTTETTTMPTMTNITNGITPGSTSTTTTINSSFTGYGYGPTSGNENISITYGPPKPVYGVPGVAPGTPLSEWTPSYLYDSPSSHYSHHHSFLSPSSFYHYPSTSYHSPSTFYPSLSSSYHSPTVYGTVSASHGSSSSSQSSSYYPNRPLSTSYGTPSSSYGAPSSSYGSPSTHYGAPSSSYGVPSSSYAGAKPPSTSYGVPSQSYGTPSAQVSSYQTYQLPYTSWYGRGASHSDIVKRAQDVIRY